MKDSTYNKVANYSLILLLNSFVFWVCTARGADFDNKEDHTAFTNAMISIDKQLSDDEFLLRDGEFIIVKDKTFFAFIYSRKRDTQYFLQLAEHIDGKFILQKFKKEVHFMDGMSTLKPEDQPGFGDAVTKVVMPASGKTYVGIVEISAGNDFSSTTISLYDPVSQTLFTGNSESVYDGAASGTDLYLPEELNGKYEIKGWMIETLIKRENLKHLYLTTTR